MDQSARRSNARRAQGVFARAIVCGILAILPACGIPNLRQPEPAPNMPELFSNGATSTQNSAQFGIEEFFNDPILTGLLSQAINGNRELKILEEEVQIARNEILARQGAYLPFVGFQGSAGLDRYGTYTLPGAGVHDDPFLAGQFLPNPLPNYLLGLSFFWQLDIWRELRNARDAAAQRYTAATERRNFFVTRLVADVAERYYGLMARDKRLENLDKIIELQEKSLKTAKARMEGARDKLGALPVHRFQAEIRKNQSQKPVVRQEIVEGENRINFLLNRFPQPVERPSARFYELSLPVRMGVPAQLLQNRPDIRQAERELAAAGLDVLVARAHFFPKPIITGTVGYDAFNPKYLFLPESFIASVAGNLVAPLINKKAIRAEFQSANAKQLESIYNYQRVVLNAFTEVVNRVAMVENYSKSFAIKRQQVESLEAAVDTADKLFNLTRIEYLDLLFAQRDLWDARLELIETKQQQLSAMANVYQALGGGWQIRLPRGPGQPPNGAPGEDDKPAQLPPPRLMPPMPSP